VDPERFERVACDRAAARERLGLDAERPLAIYLGSFAPHKGVGTVLAAAGLRPDVDFLLVGGSEEEIAEWRPHFECLPNVALRGFVGHAEVPDHLAAADLCLVPNSASDRTARWTYSLKLYESMAARRPIVASDIPSLRAATGDGRAALLVPPDDAAALADAVGRILADPAVAAPLVEAAWETARSHTWDARARDVLHAFAPELLGERRLRAESA